VATQGASLYDQAQMNRIREEYGMSMQPDRTDDDASMAAAIEETKEFAKEVVSAPVRALGRDIIMFVLGYILAVITVIAGHFI
jgi:hypothetical protein